MITHFLPASETSGSTEQELIYPTYDTENEDGEGVVIIPSEQAIDELFADEIDDDDRELMKDVLNIE